MDTYFRSAAGGIMKLDRENMRKMKELIVFTIIILIALWNYNILFEWIGFAFGIIFPFILAEESLLF